MRFTPAFSSTYENPIMKIYSFIHSSMRKNRKKKSGRNKKCWKELTPRMQYQSMKVVFVGFERILWTQDAERVEMEQISITNLDLESESCPIWKFDMNMIMIMINENVVEVKDKNVNMD
jgi:hypothetical protein